MLLVLSRVAIALISTLVLLPVIPPTLASGYHKHSSETWCFAVVRNDLGLDESDLLKGVPRPRIGQTTCSARIRYVSDPSELCPDGPALGPQCCSGGTTPVVRSGPRPGDERIVGVHRGTGPHLQDADHRGIHVNVSYAVNRLVRFTVNVSSYDVQTGEWGRTYPERRLHDSRAGFDTRKSSHAFTLDGGRLPHNRGPAEHYVVNLTMESGAGTIEMLLEYNGPTHWNNNTCEGSVTYQFEDTFRDGGPLGL